MRGEVVVANRTADQQVYQSTGCTRHDRSSARYRHVTVVPCCVLYQENELSVCAWAISNMVAVLKLLRNGRQ